jgi:hypothetical protein
VVHGRRFVVAGLVECIDMADKEISVDKDLEMSDEMVKYLTQQAKDAKMDSAMDDAWDRFYGKEKSEEDVKKFSGGGVVDGASYSRGTGAQVRGRIFRGVF